MSTSLDNEVLDLLFRQARTHNVWLDRPVPDDILRQLYDLVKFGPTSANSNPARILFLRTREAKQRLRAALSSTNADKTMQAPVTAIPGLRSAILRRNTELFPQQSCHGQCILQLPAAGQNHRLSQWQPARRDFILAARALGLDSALSRLRSPPKIGTPSFLPPEPGILRRFIRLNPISCAISAMAIAAAFSRNPRLAFEEACRAVAIPRVRKPERLDVIHERPAALGVLPSRFRRRIKSARVVLSSTSAIASRTSRMMIRVLQCSTS